MEHKKIIIDEDAYIRYLNKDDYELHVRTWGPNGAWVYKFERGNLKWRQMMNTLHGLNDLIAQLSQLKSDDDAETIVSEETLDTCYEHLANIWS